ncbi:hypothetical protein MNBD_NITROSPIRAE01-851 [hydrothermal vent metagenome]|uniref:Uncharacterized protein n=1 Tax=hydrothermal vent metagenome TaxID=652676 RepID=A0A3B1DNH8_9ZZZZ
MNDIPRQLRHLPALITEIQTDPLQIITLKR